jgi:hypothetical protein
MDVSTAMGAKIKETLKIAQRIETPILLTPVLQQLSWEKTGKKYTSVRHPYAAAQDASCIIYGPPDAGSTIFLEDLCQQINASDSNRLAVYCDYADIKEVKTGKRMMQRFADASGVQESELGNVSTSLIVDHISGTDPDIVTRLLTLCEDISHVVLCLKNDTLFDTLAAALRGADHVVFFRLRYWGPSRLRQFTTRYIAETGMDADSDAAFKFISDSLSLSDLPVSPFLAALYLRVFFEFGGKLTGISFVRLIERLEESSLDRADAGGNYSLYNLRHMLMMLACECYKRGTLGVPRAVYSQSVDTYFRERALQVDASRLISHLVESGIVVSDGADVIAFSCVVFFNYYLAQAVEEKEICLDEHLERLHTALRLGDALAYYAGRHRDEEKLAQALLRCLEKEYTPRTDTTAEDLEKYIHHLLSAETPASEKDVTAKGAVDAKIDYETADSDFEERQNDNRAVGQHLMRVAPPQSKIEKVAWNIMALKTFYNVFRNLEHIKARSKKELLDRILDFHLHCNMELIDLYSSAMQDEQFTSLCAYMVTIGGEAFLSQNVGSAALEETINSLIAETTNDLKLFLLHCIYADLHLPGYAGRLQAFLENTSNIALLEMGYAKVYELLVRYEHKSLPASLISAFNSAFDCRQKFYGTRSPIDLQRLRDKALNEAKQRFLQQSMDKDAQ